MLVNAVRCSKEVAAHAAYRRRINAFLMDLIHSLCFADNTAPDADVIRTLIGYVIGERKERKDGDAEKKKGKKCTAAMTPVPESVDRTPIFRSFLLQLLLRAK